MKVTKRSRILIAFMLLMGMAAIDVAMARCSVPRAPTTSFRQGMRQLERMSAALSAGRGQFNFADARSFLSDQGWVHRDSGMIDGHNYHVPIADMNFAIPLKTMTWAATCARHSPSFKFWSEHHEHFLASAHSEVLYDGSSRLGWMISFLGRAKADNEAPGDAPPKPEVLKEFSVLVIYFDQHVVFDVQPELTVTRDDELSVSGSVDESTVERMQALATLDWDAMPWGTVEPQNNSDVMVTRAVDTIKQDTPDFAFQRIDLVYDALPSELIKGKFEGSHWSATFQDIMFRTESFAFADGGKNKQLRLVAAK